MTAAVVPMLEREELCRAAREGIPVLLSDRVSGLYVVGQVVSVIESYSGGKPKLCVELSEIGKSCIYRCLPEALTLYDGISIKGA